MDSGSMFSISGIGHFLNLIIQRFYKHPVRPWISDFLPSDIGDCFRQPGIEISVLDQDRTEFGVYLKSIPVVPRWGLKLRQKPPETGPVIFFQLPKNRILLKF